MHDNKNRDLLEWVPFIRILMTGSESLVKNQRLLDTPMSAIADSALMILLCPSTRSDSYLTIDTYLEHLEKTTAA